MAKPVKLLETIARRVERSPMDLDIERSAGFARGTYTKLLRGTTKLRLHHVEGLRKALGISVLDLFWEAYGREDGETRLADLFIRLLRPEIECLLRPNGSLSAPESLTQRFLQIQVEE